MERLIPKSTLKQAAFGQCLVHLLRSRSAIPPILFGLGVSLDHVFGSKWLINLLSKLGWCVGPEEVTRYKQNVVDSDQVTDYLQRDLLDSFTHWSADNVDHNVATWTGKELSMQWAF
jgi:hypothetical protein